MLWILILLNFQPPIPYNVSRSLRIKRMLSYLHCCENLRLIPYDFQTSLVKINYHRLWWIVRLNSSSFQDFEPSFDCAKFEGCIYKVVQRIIIYIIWLLLYLYNQISAATLLEFNTFAQHNPRNWRIIY